MIKLDSLYDLKKHPPTSHLVYVRTVKRLYRNIDGEWIEKMYYSIKETAEILGLSDKRVGRMVKKLGVNPSVVKSDNLNYDQLTLIAKAAKIKKDKPCIKYTDIKKKLKI
jgi:hypothetical protein